MIRIILLEPLEPTRLSVENERRLRYQAPCKQVLQVLIALRIKIYKETTQCQGGGDILLNNSTFCFKQRLLHPTKPLYSNSLMATKLIVIVGITGNQV